MSDKNGGGLCSFRGARIPQFEADVLQALETQSGKQFTLVNKVEWSTQMGFSVGNNRIMAIGLYKCEVSTLPESIGQLSSLKELRLQSNQLSTLPVSIGDLKSLQSLEMQYNNLTTLPESIGQLSTLKKLKVENNQLSILPESIGGLKSLTYLDMSRNNLSTLPESVTQLRSLHYLHFSGNQITTLRGSIGNLSSLQILALNGNQLSTLPESIGQLSSLKELFLNVNQLSTLPESIGQLSSLQILWINKNQLMTLPDSMLNAKFLQMATLDGNSLNNQNFINKCKANALKSSGVDKQVIMSFAEQWELGMKEKPDGETPEDVIQSDIKVNKKNRLFPYAGIVVLSGLFAFLALGPFFQGADKIILWVLFFIALGINILVGASIISTLSGYLKKVLDRVKNAESSIKRRALGFFDVFVAFYLVWSIRAAVKTILSVELIAAVDIAFEYALPPQVLGFLAVFGYDMGLTFLENLDLFLGHFFFKLFGLTIVFWALYKNGIGYVKKTAFEEEKEKNIKVFLVLGLVGSIVLALMNYSTLAPLLSIGYNIGAIIACCVFAREKNKTHPMAFYLYVSTIGSGIFVVWALSLWNIAISFGAGVIFIALFFYARYRFDIVDRYIKHDVEKRQAKTLRKLQVKTNILLPSVENIGAYKIKIGVNIKGKNVLGITMQECNLSALPESIGQLSMLKELRLNKNQLTTLPESIGQLSTLKELRLYNNQLTTLPESIGNLKLLTNLDVRSSKFSTLPESIGQLFSLKELSISNNQLSTLPESIGQLSSLQKLWLQNNKLSTLPESIGQLSTLKELSISNNQLSTLPESIGNLRLLESLDLTNNKFETLPDSIRNLVSLKDLRLRGNPLVNTSDSRTIAILDQLKKNGVRISK